MEARAMNNIRNVAKLYVSDIAAVVCALYKRLWYTSYL